MLCKFNKTKQKDLALVDKDQCQAQLIKGNNKICKEMIEKLQQYKAIKKFLQLVVIQLIIRITKLMITKMVY